MNNGDLALNLSFVLHEHSGSQVVHAAVRAVQAHDRITQEMRSNIMEPVTRTGAIGSGITRWLSATVGLPQHLPDALGVASDQIVLIDAAGVATERRTFFRAPALLAIPDLIGQTIGVATLVLRPDRRSSHLIVSGPFDWPEQRRDALRELERVIQAYAGQWTPPRAVWDAPAEMLLPDEIHLGSVDASRMS